MKAMLRGLVISAVFGYLGLGSVAAIAAIVDEFTAPPPTQQEPSERPAKRNDVQRRQSSRGNRSGGGQGAQSQGNKKKETCTTCTADRKKSAPGRGGATARQAPPPAQPSAPSVRVAKLYAARAFCSITKVAGEGLAASPSRALQAAITECRQRGGVPDCCRNGARPITVAGYSAISRCSLTGKAGAALRQRTPNQAMASAVADCVAKGGIPDCCRSGTVLVQFATP